MYKSNDGRGNHGLSSQPVSIGHDDSTLDRRERILEAKRKRECEKQSVVNWLDGGRNIVFLR